MPVDVPQGASAKVGCKQNVDAGGPPAATFTLARDEGALGSAFDAVVANMRVVNWPGNIQSPGPWRRNATPQQVSGSWFAVSVPGPTLAWTDDGKLVVSSVDGADIGPTSTSCTFGGRVTPDGGGQAGGGAITVAVGTAVAGVPAGSGVPWLPAGSEAAAGAPGTAEGDAGVVGAAGVAAVAGDVNE